MTSSSDSDSPIEEKRQSLHESDDSSSEDSQDIVQERQMRRAEIKNQFEEWRKNKTLFWIGAFGVTFLFTIVLVAGIVTTFLADQDLELIIGILIIVFSLLSLVIWILFVAFAIIRGRRMLCGEFDWSEFKQLE